MNKSPLSFLSRVLLSRVLLYPCALIALFFSLALGEPLQECSAPHQGDSVHEQQFLQIKNQKKSSKSRLKATSVGKKKAAKALSAEELDSPDRWPTQVPVPRNMRLKEIKAKKGDKGNFFYETNNYRFSSEVKLSEESQKSIGRLFECAFAANRAISRVLPLVRAKRNRTARTKLQAILYADQASYVEAGGAEGSSGYFTYSYRKRVGSRKFKMNEKMIRRDLVMIPLVSLGVSVSGKLEDKNVNSHTLVHEITHQCNCLNQLPIWANEGLSEYVAYVPYNGDMLDFDLCFKNIVDAAKMRKAVLDFPFSLEEFFLMDQEEFYEYMSKGKDTYYLSVLTVCYFIHLQERVGVKNFKNYLSRVYKGNSHEKSLPYLNGRKRDRSILQKDFIKAWKEQGVDIKLKKHEAS